MDWRSANDVNVSSARKETEEKQSPKRPVSGLLGSTSTIGLNAPRQSATKMSQLTLLVSPKNLAPLQDKP